MRKIHIDEEEWAARKLRLSTMQIVALGFMGIILAGGLLLWLPFSNRQPISFLAGGIGVAELTWFISNRTNGWKTYQRLNEKISVGISRRLGR